MRPAPLRPALSCLALLSGLCVPLIAFGQEAPLRVEAERRSLPPAPAKAPSAPSPGARVGSIPATHKVGRAPRTPAATLPPDVPLSGASERARKAIAEGELPESLAKGAPDPQLEELHAVDEILFPEQLRGLTPGFSFEVPRADAAGGVALGLPHRAQGLDHSAVSEEDAGWLRTLTMPDLPVRLDRRVVTYLKFYRDSPRGRTIAAIWAKKRGRYAASMKAALRRAGLPSDLIWMSMIESGYNPTIASPAGAVGLWQFMPESGQMYGLTVDRWVDERRDPARSTQAAIRFLSDLYQRFGNWELAMAAYNMGYAGMSRAIAKYNSNDYWTLSRLEGGIPWETTLYVPKVFALAVVMNNPLEFGLGNIKPDPAVSFDSILVEPATPLKSVAAAAGVTVAELAALNPQLLSDRVPPAAPGAKGDKFPVAVPRGRGPSALRALATRSGKSVRTIELRLGDQVATLAAGYGVSEAALMAENGLAAGEALRAGTVLVLPSGARATQLPPQRDAVVVSRRVQAGPGEKVVLYDVGPGDELSEIAHAFSVSEAEIARDNALDPRARLRAGMTLQIVVAESRDLGHVRHQSLSSELSRLVMVAGSPEFHEYFEGLKGKKRLEIVVRKGDTLAGLGSRYGMTVGSMERVNRRSRSAPLLPGERLVVYTDRAQASAPGDLGAEALGPIKPARPDYLPSALAGKNVESGAAGSPGGVQP